MCVVVWVGVGGCGGGGVGLWMSCLLVWVDWGGVLGEGWVGGTHTGRLTSFFQPEVNS